MENIFKQNVVFGLKAQGHIQTIERILKENDSHHSYYVWTKIGKEIGWEPLTALCYYLENFELVPKQENK